MNLHQAAAEGSIDAIKQLLAEGADINAQDEAGNTPLHVACLAGKVDVVRHLANMGADITSVNKAKQTAAQATSSLTTGSEKVKRAIFSALRNAQNAGKMLADAVTEGNYEAALKLLEAKCPRHFKGPGGRRPLHLAAEAGKVELVRLLLQHGADKAKPDADGQTALDVARAAGQEAAVQLLADEPARVNGAANGAAVDDPNNKTVTAQAGQLASAGTSATASATVTKRPSSGSTRQRKQRAAAASSNPPLQQQQQQVPAPEVASTAASTKQEDTTQPPQQQQKQEEEGKAGVVQLQARQSVALGGQASTSAPAAKTQSGGKGGGAKKGAAGSGQEQDRLQAGWRELEEARRQLEAERRELEEARRKLAEERQQWEAARQGGGGAGVAAGGGEGVGATDRQVVALRERLAVLTEELQQQTVLVSGRAGVLEQELARVEALRGEVLERERRLQGVLGEACRRAQEQELGLHAQLLLAQQQRQHLEQLGVATAAARATSIHSAPAARPSTLSAPPTTAAPPPQPIIRPAPQPSLSGQQPRPTALTAAQQIGTLRSATAPTPPPRPAGAPKQAARAAPPAAATPQPASTRPPQPTIFLTSQPMAGPRPQATHPATLAPLSTPLGLSIPPPGLPSTLPGNPQHTRPWGNIVHTTSGSYLLMPQSYYLPATSLPPGAPPRPAPLPQPPTTRPYIYLPVPASAPAPFYPPTQPPAAALRPPAARPPAAPRPTAPLPKLTPTIITPSTAPPGPPSEPSSSDGGASRRGARKRSRPARFTETADGTKKRSRQRNQQAWVRSPAVTPGAPPTTPGSSGKAAAGGAKGGSGGAREEGVVVIDGSSSDDEGGEEGDYMVGPKYQAQVPGSCLPRPSRAAASPKDQRWLALQSQPAPGLDAAPSTRHGQASTTRKLLTTGEEAAFAAGMRELGRAALEQLQQQYLPDTPLQAVVLYFYRVWKMRVTEDSRQYYNERAEAKAEARRREEEAAQAWQLWLKPCMLEARQQLADQDRHTKTLALRWLRICAQTSVYNKAPGSARYPKLLRAAVAVLHNEGAAELATRAGEGPGGPPPAGSSTPG